LSAPNAKQISNATLAWLFFLSGVLALIYEALWQRRFSLIFGSSAPATAAVLAAYFAGLALGAFVIGNRVHRFSSPLTLYAILELGIAVGAILVELFLTLFSSIASSSILLKTILAFVALGIPTFCMGGTLPALGAFIDRDEHHLGRTAGLLYTANTAGAALGVLAVPLLLLPILGAHNTLYVTAALNLLIAITAFQLGRARCPQRAASNPMLPSNPNRSHAATPTSPLILSFLSGAIAFLIQILWNRAFAQIHENSLYSFALIAAVFIAALAVGAQLTRLLLKQNVKPATLISFSWLAAAILVVVTPFLFVRATNNLSYISANSSTSHAFKLFQISLLAIFPTATLLGMALPAIMESAGRSTSSTAKTLGALLAANLIGGAVGSLLAGFFLPYWHGTWHGMIVAAVLLIAFGMPRKFRWALIVVLPAIIALTHVELPRVRLNQNEKLLTISEGPHGIVAVTERANSRRLKLNNSYVLGGTASTGDERMQSHLPLLLHPDPQRVAYLGLGTGISAGAATLHPIQQITLLELVPEVAQAARAHFAEANLHILDKPNARLIVEDARNFLRHTDENFDVIIGDLVVPWRAGEAALFTQENFRAGKNSLKPGGLFCQWLPLFQLSEDQFRIILNTFLSVFPEAHLWRADFSPNETALALIGFSDTTTVDAQIIRQRLGAFVASPSPPVGEGRGEGAATPGARSLDPANPQLTDDYAVWMNFIGTITRAEVNPSWRINSENRPWVELSGPPGTNAFVGRALQKWTRELSAISLTRFHLTEREAAAIHAGDLLFQFTLALSENNRSSAAQAQQELKNLLPSDVFQILFPP
jgi:spermidine synthase